MKTKYIISFLVVTFLFFSWEIFYHKTVSISAVITDYAKKEPVAGEPISLGYPSTRIILKKHFLNENNAIKWIDSIDQSKSHFDFASKTSNSSKIHIESIFIE